MMLEEGKDRREKRSGCQEGEREEQTVKMKRKNRRKEENSGCTNRGRYHIVQKRRN